MSEVIRVVFRINPAEHPDLASALLSKPANQRNKFARGLLIRAFYGSVRETTMDSPNPAATTVPAKNKIAPIPIDALDDPSSFGFGRQPAC